MSKRRTAEEALNMPDAVKDFIDRGVSDRQIPQHDASQAVARGSRDEQPTQSRKVIELDDSRAPFNPHGPSARDASQSLAVDLSRTYAKATVQKTIRFHPRLIAELEAHTRKQELEGEKPIPFQQVQNEALDLWLERHVRHLRKS